MKYFLDTEFIEEPNTIQLISIGIKCEDGREYYAISNEYRYHKASDWVKKNIITPMYIGTVHGDQRNRIGISYFQNYYGKPVSKIKEDLLEFIGEDPEFWGYYSDYDWVVFCWIFGKMVDLPVGYPMYCRDLKQALDFSNVEGTLPEQHNEHNALEDAKWNEELYNHIFKET